MSVAKFVQPVTSQDNSTYKGSIDASLAVVQRISNPFAPREAATPDMTVIIGAGDIFTDQVIERADQTSLTIVAPTTNPRIDRIGLSTTTGLLVYVKGTEAASPVAPDYPVRVYPICQFQLATSTTTITNSMLTDERAIPRQPQTHPLLVDPYIVDWVTQTPSTVSISWADIAWSEDLGLFCAVGGAGIIMTSPNGIDWTTQTTPNTNIMAAVAWSPELGLFAATCASGTGNRVMTSPDGVTWTSRTSAADLGWYSIDWSPQLGLFCAIANSGTTTTAIMTSPDGVTWTSRTNSATFQSWAGIAWGNVAGLFIAVNTVGTGPAAISSTNGTTWTNRTVTGTPSLRAITYSPTLNLFVAVSGGGGTSQVWTTQDAVTWTNQTTPSPTRFWTDVTWSPQLGLFIAVANTGTGDRIMTSPDGVNWTNQSSAQDISWAAVAWGGKAFRAVAVASSGTNRCMSTDY